LILKIVLILSNSKQQSFTDLKANNDNRVSYNDVKDIFLSRKETLPMETSLDMNNNIIFNVKNPNRLDHAVNKGYLDQAFEQNLSNPATKDLSVGSLEITNLSTPRTHENDATINVSFFNTELNVSNIGLSSQLTNAYKKYVNESHLKPSGQQKDVFRYLMEDEDESSSESNITNENNKLGINPT